MECSVLRDVCVCSRESEPRSRSELDGLSCRSEIIGTYGALAALAALFPSLSVPYLFIAVIDQVSLSGCHTSAVALCQRTKRSSNSRALQSQPYQTAKSHLVFCLFSC